MGIRYTNLLTISSYLTFAKFFLAPQHLAKSRVFLNVKQFMTEWRILQWKREK